MRSDRIERLLKLIQSLQSGRAQAVDDLVKLTGVSRRTIFRDLDLLTRAGIPYTFDRANKRYSTERTTLLPPVSLTHADALALLMTTRFLRSGAQAPDAAAAESAALKIESMLPAALRDYCVPLVEHTEIRPAPASDASAVAETIPLLQSALARRKKVRIRYDSYYEGHVLDVTLHPYRLAFIHRGWYLIAFSELHDEVRTFKIERTLELKPLAEEYEIDPAFNLDEYFGHAWLMIRGDRRYHVVIRFREKVAGNVDEIAWHKTQRTTYQENGTLLFEVDVDGIDEIAWWVLGYGSQAQVLEPPELQKLVANHARQVCQYYNADEKQ